MFDAIGNYALIFPLIYFAILAAVAFIWLAAPRKVQATKSDETAYAE